MTKLTNSEEKKCDHHPDHDRNTLLFPTTKYQMKKGFIIMTHLFIK